MRERFRGWGAGLSDAEFACALAAVGTEIQSRPRPGSGLLVWRLGERFDQSDAGELARAWRAFIATMGTGTVLIDIDPRSLARLEIDPGWVREQLSRAEVGAGAVRIRAMSHASKEEPPPPPPDGWVMPPQDRPDVGTKGTNSYAVGEEGWERPSPRPVSAVRFLQARVQELTATSCQAAVRIGLPDRGWTSLDRPFPPLPPQPEGHWLTVIFWEPRVSPEPQVKPLWLPPEGNSEPVLFPFEAPADGLASIAARITVLHANRVLQTGVLQAATGADRWTFKLDAVPRTRLEGLDHRSHFDAALVLNHDEQGTSRLTVAADDSAVVLELEENPIQRLTEFLNDRISTIADEPERYEGLESPGSLELLRALARMGATVHDSLCKHTDLTRLAGARRIQITSAKVESFLPVELLYRFGAPSPAAQLCPHALAALEAGDCAADCPSDKRQTVCPLGFWGLSRVIERHEHKPKDQKRISGDFELRAEPVAERSPLVLTGSALLAASGKVSSVKKDAVTELLLKLQARGPAALASTWAEWEQHVESDRPHLLVLLPHHERKDGFEVLEIGESDRLEVADILDEKVRREDGPHPIVLLMGCETNLTRIRFDNPASLFKDHGAAIVVSTIATILGRHASPATALLVDLLDQMADGQRTFGEVMLRLRQTLVARSTAMALGLTAYGDADWVLTKER